MPYCSASYGYSPQQRLNQFTQDGISTTYSYDPTGVFRLSKSNASGTAYYLYNQNGLAAEYDSAGSLKVEYHFAPQAGWGMQPMFIIFGMIVGGSIEAASQVAQGSKCIDWSSVAISAAASLSPVGRIGYKATLLRNKKIAQTMDGDSAYKFRAQIKKDFRLFKPVDDFLKKRDTPRDKIRDPVDSFDRSNSRD